MANIYDVATRAGVSTTAVSAVLNGKKHKVSESTRQNILNAIKELGYRPSKVARQLATGRFDAIALYLERSPHELMYHNLLSEIFTGIADFAASIHQYIVLAPSDPKDPFNQVAEVSRAIGVDGAIVVGPVTLKSYALQAIEKKDFPIVCIDSSTDFNKTSTVDVDNYTGMKKGTQHLIQQGHKRIAYITTPFGYQCQADRQRGFRDAMDESGLEIDEQLVGFLSAEQVAPAMAKMMDVDPPPTAVICEGIRAIPVCDVLPTLGFRIPDDISVLEFSGLPEGYAELNSISTITPPFYAMGNMAASTLKKIIDGELEPPVHIRLSAKFQFRP